MCLMLVGEISPNVGTTGFNFLKITPTAREAAMGCVAVGFSDNAAGIWYNPAGITGAVGSQVGLGYIAYAAGVQSGTVSHTVTDDLSATCNATYDVTLSVH